MERSLTIGHTRIADDTDAFVIAEIGHNHQGDPQQAEALIRHAAAAGANAAKLQKRHNRTLFTAELYDAAYDDPHSFGPSYGSHREALELPIDTYATLLALGRSLSLDVFATVFDPPSADAMARVGVPAFKIASGDLTNVPLLRHVARLGRPLIVSTGGGSLADIDRAVDVIQAHTRQLALLHCVARYPTPIESINLSAITTLRLRYPGLVIGLSDHYPDSTFASAAYALGARIIEKHVTLDRRLKGRDHAFSLEPAGLRALVETLRSTRLAMGDGRKDVSSEERAALLKMSKKLVAARRLEAGHQLTAEDIAVRSPGDGLPPWRLDDLIGQVVTRAMRADEAFTPDQIVQHARTDEKPTRHEPVQST